MQRTKEHRSLIAALIAVLTVILSVGVSALTPVWAADEEEGIVLTHVAKESGNTDPAAFATGTLMQSQVALKANLPSSEYSGAYLAISYPNEASSFIGSMEPIIDYSTSEVFTRGQSVGNEYRIYLKDSDDARDTSFPLLTKFATFVTPNGYELPLTLTLKKADGSVVKSAEVVTYKAIAGGADYTYDIVGGQNQIGGISSDGQVLDQTGLVDVTFTYTPSFTVQHRKDPYSVFNNETGARLYNPLNLVQPLPEYAHFDPAKNPGWTLNAASQELTYTFDSKDFDDVRYRSVSLNLTFPGAPVNQTFTTTSTMTFNVVNPQAQDQPVVQTRTVNYRFETEPPGASPVHKYFVKAANDPADRFGTHNAVINETSRLNAGLRWGLMLENTHNVPLTITNFTDYDLDSRLYYSGVSLPRDFTNLEFSGRFLSEENFNILPRVTVIAELDDGTTQTMGTVRRGATLTFPDTATAKRITKLSFQLPDGYTLSRNQFTALSVITKFKDTPTLSNDQALNRYDNSVSYEGHHESINGNTYSVRNQATEYFTLVPKKIDVGFQKVLSDRLGTGWFAQTRDEPVRADGELAIWEWRPWFSGTSDDAIKGIAGREVVENLEIIDLLPEGVTYDKAATEQQSRSILRYGTITYHENYQESGLNAVVVTFPRISVSNFNRLVDNESLKIVTRVNANSLPGKNVNTFLVKVGGQFIASSDTHHMAGQGYNFGGLDSFVDSRDLDQDGDTTEAFAFASASYEYTAKQELIARTYIARATVDNFTRDGLKTGLDAPFRYKLYNYNNKVSAIRKFELVSLLPYVGDHSSARDATTNEYAARNSQFVNTMTGPATVTTRNAEKFTVLYTTDALSGVVTEPSTRLTWTESVSDYSQVTGIKVVLKDGQSFASGEELDVIVPMKAPSQTDLAARAYVDFAISTDGSDFVPTNRVWNEIYEPSSDLVIVKSDENGQPLAGATFRVSSKENPQVVHEVTTNAAGRAQVTLPLGEYTVVETEAPAGYVLDTRSRDVSIVEDETAEITLTNQPRRLVVTKVDAADTARKLQGATFELRAADGTVVGASQVTNAQGEVIFTKLPAGTYQLVETQAPAGYVLSSTPITVTVPNEGATVQVENTLITQADVTARKVWVNGPNERPGIHFALYRQVGDGEVKRVPGTDIQAVPAGGEVTWNGLDQSDGLGNAFTFTVKEVDANGNDYTPAGYTKTENGLTVTNTYTPELTTITAHKVWVGGVEAEHGEVSLQLWQKVGDSDPVEVGAPVTTTASVATWANVPVTNNSGETIIYSVTEIDGPSNYAVTYSGRADTGFTVTNTITGRVSVPVTKVWNGISSDVAPTVTVDLFADGVKVDEAQLDAASTWQHTFADLDQYRNGVEIAYTVVERGAAGGIVTLGGHEFTVDTVNEGNSWTLTNTLVNPSISIPVTKVWADGDNKDGIRPDAVTIRLLADGEDTGKTVVLNDSNAWNAEFSDVPTFNMLGQEIVYSVDEIQVEGYTSEISGSAREGFVVTNTHEPVSPPIVPEEPRPTEPAKPQTPRGRLAVTGANTVMFGALSAALLVAGVLTWRRRHER